MKDIKLIALDLDGTLLDSQKRLSPKNEKALEACIEKGIQVVPCTGRIWFAVPECVRNIPGIQYAITTNGAVIENIAEGRILEEHKLSCEVAVEILEMAGRFHTMYDAYAGGMAFGEERFLNNLSEYGIEPQIKELMLRSRTPVKSVVEEIKKLNLPVEKINCFFCDPNERRNAIEVFSKRKDVEISSSFANNVEINALGATKGNAILFLAKHLGISPEQTMGFGDEKNDVTMMRYAGTGVAMGNAIDQLKEEADYVTVTNDEDGVAYALEKLGVIWNS